jgi:hypothetical protein
MFIKLYIMKKYFFILFLFLASVSFSQIEKPITKGSMLIGGSIKHSTLSIHFTNFQFNASPSFGYFVADHFAVGMELPVSIFKMSQIHNYSYGYSPFVRYYFNNGLFASVQFSQIFTDYQDINMIRNKMNYFVVAPGIGYSYFLNKNVALEGGVFYEESFYKNSIGNQGELSFRFGLQIFIP